VIWAIVRVKRQTLRVFSAILTQRTDVTFLQQFTGYRREFIDEIALNVVNNGLWKNDERQDAS
jgi:hypothetical protein